MILPDDSTDEGKISLFRLRGLLRKRLDRHGPQSADPIQDDGEHLPGHRHLGQLEDDLLGMPHDPAAEALNIFTGGVISS